MSTCSSGTSSGCHWRTIALMTQGTFDGTEWKDPLNRKGRPHRPHTLNLRSQSQAAVSLHICVLTCRIGTIIMPTSWAEVKMKWDHLWQPLSIVFSAHKAVAIYVSCHSQHLSYTMSPWRKEVCGVYWGRCLHISPNHWNLWLAPPGEVEPHTENAEPPHG